METINQEINISYSTDNESSVVVNGNKYKNCMNTLYNSIKYETNSNKEEEDYNYNNEEDYSDEELEYELDEYDYNVYGNKICHTKGNKVDKYVSTFYDKNTKLEIEQTVEYDKLKLETLKHNIAILEHNILNYEPIEEVIINTDKYKHLIDEFKAGHIRLKLASRPSEFSTKRAKLDSTTESFLMDLRRNDGEYIIIYPGVESIIEVYDINTDFSQVLLSVKEPERKLTIKKEVFRKKLGKTIVRNITTITKAEERLFLIGKDEGHMFIAQIKDACATVKQAHKSLLPIKLRKWRKQDYRRQGEWFFVARPLYSPSRWWKGEIHLRVGTGRAHIAENNDWQKGKYIFVKGTVQHPDHKTINLNDWHEVISNNELRSEIKGLTWID